MLLTHNPAPRQAFVFFVFIHLMIEGSCWTDCGRSQSHHDGPKTRSGFPLLTLLLRNLHDKGSSFSTRYCSMDHGLPVSIPSNVFLDHFAILYAVQYPSRSSVVTRPFVMFFFWAAWLPHTRLKSFIRFHQADLKAASLYCFFPFFPMLFMVVLYALLPLGLLTHTFWVSQFDKSLFQRVQSMYLLRPGHCIGARWGGDAPAERAGNWQVRLLPCEFNAQIGNMLAVTLVQFDAGAAGSMGNLVHQPPCDLHWFALLFSGVQPEREAAQMDALEHCRRLITSCLKVVQDLTQN